jgi:hypothetical protein
MIAPSSRTRSASRVPDNIDKPTCFESPQPPRVMTEVWTSAGQAIGN